MDRKYQLILSIENTDKTVTLEGEFDLDDWNRIKAFDEYANALLDTNLAQNSVPLSLNIKWGEESQLAFKTELPPWDDVIVFLHKYRPIGLQSESTYFYSICNVLSKELHHPHFRNMIQQQRDMFKGKTLQTQFKLTVNDTVVNSEKVLNDWLNAYEYHRNKEKQELIDSINSILTADFTKAIFLTLLHEKALAIHNIASFTSVILRKKRQLLGTIKQPD